MKGTLVLAMIKQKFKVTLGPEQTIVVEPKMTLQPKNGILMRIENRLLVGGDAR